MFPGRSLEVKADLAKKVQDFLVKELNLEEKYISVSIEDVAVENWDESMKKIPADTMYISRKS